MSNTVLSWRKDSSQHGEVDCAVRIITPEKLRRALSLERARADRSRHEFSLVTLRVANDLSRHRVEAVISRCHNWPGHEPAQAGWLSSDRLAILLPAASAETAEVIARSILEELAQTLPGSTQRIEWRMDTYPGNGCKQRRSWQSFNRSNTDAAFGCGRNGGTLTADAEPASALVGTHSAALANGPADVLPGERRPPTIATYIQRLDIRICPWWKRAMDLAGATVGLIVLAPLFLLVAAYIKCVSPGPVYFRQRRYGLAGRPFTMWKFRTIRASQSHEDWQEAHVADLMRNDRPLQKRDLSSCVIPGGALLRRFGIDELPQLFNVLRGEMSLVGPRPDVLPFASYPVWQRRRFDVEPGITGLWQVSGKNTTTFTTMIRLDIDYVRRRSFWLDVSILLRTLVTVLQN